MEEEFSVSDVYQHAAMIGQDIEGIVNDYGKEAIVEIMPKIVFVLEQLELLAEKHRTDLEKIQELCLEKESLVIHTKRDEAIQRQLEEKLNYMEELVSQDKDGLRSRIKQLQQENDCLCDELDKRENELVKLRTHGALPGDVEVMMRMKTTIDEQRDKIRQLNGELSSQMRNIDALQDNSARLTSLNENLRRNVFVLQAKVKQYQANNSLTEVDGYHESHDSSLIEIDRSIIDSQLDDIDEKEEDISLQSELLATGDTSFDTTCDEPIASQETEKLPEDERPGTRSTKDPDRPRYTLKEMQDVLEERNRFKIEKLALEEELDLYKKAGVRIRSDVPDKPGTMRKKQGGVRNLMSKFYGKQ